MALERVLNTPRIEVHPRTGSIGIVPPNGVIPKGVALDDGSVIECCNGAQSVMGGKASAAAVCVTDSTVPIGLTPPVDYVPPDVTIRNRNNDVLDVGISAVLDIGLVIFHELFHKGLQNVLSPASFGPKPTLYQIQRLVDKVLQVAKNVIPVSVIGNPGQIAGIRVPAGTKPKGALIDGRIYLFADNIQSLGDAYVTLFHELFLQRIQNSPYADYVFSF